MNLKLLFGGIPDSTNYEKQRNQLQDEYNRLQDIEQSDQYQEYIQLADFVHSSAIKDKKKELVALKYKNSDAGNKEKEFRSLENDKDIKRYFKLINSNYLEDFEKISASNELARYHELEDYLQSDEYIQTKVYMKKSSAKRFKETDEYQALQETLRLKKDPEVKAYLKKKKKGKINDEEEPSDKVIHFLELEKYVNSDEFLQRKKEILTQKFQDTEAYQKWNEWKQLKESNDIKFFHSFQKSALYKNYLNTKDSDKLKRYEELSTYLKSKEFKEEKEYLLLKPKDKYELTPEYKQELRYKELLNSEDISWYLKNKGHKRFTWFEQWQLTFEDNFDESKLNKDVWLTKYYWGEELLHSNYSLANEKHCFTDKNLQVSGSSVKIITRRENAEGISWDPVLGFAPKFFEYTSGLMSTGKSFRQQYGIFEAKIKFSAPQSVTHAFWMVSNHIMPHIDIMKTNGQVSLGNFWGDLPEKNSIRKNRSAVKASRLTGYNIYRLEWSKDALLWKINGATVFKATKGIPQEPMFLVFSSHVYRDIDPANTPSSLELDWVRCYQKTNN
ncbi:MAG: family 16 glycosylhydrolase [Bacteroidetes bacterium]|jgi:hypothetical protein|nr:family 16 glycosylhydrolase [Bacteroidota bacterium]